MRPGPRNTDFKHYVGVQVQSRDRFLWSGIGAVALAFSLFLSLLFVFKIADWYSRGTFFFQFIGAATAILITRGTIHAHIRRAIASGAVEARRAVVIGDPNDDREILNNLRQSGTTNFPVVETAAALPRISRDASSRR